MINKIMEYLKRYGYRGNHRKLRGGTEYHKPGATHEGSWYDEPTQSVAIPSVADWVLWS